MGVGLLRSPEALGYVVMYHLPVSGQPLARLLACFGNTVYNQRGGEGRSSPHVRPYYTRIRRRHHMHMRIFAIR